LNLDFGHGLESGLKLVMTEHWLVGTKEFDMSNDMKDEMFDFLDAVRESGAVNMFEGGRLIQEQYGLGRYEARDILVEWMKTYPRTVA
jgi:hypothetical protein